MSDTSFNSQNFVDQAESIILENVSNEQFGVSELAEAMNAMTQRFCEIRDDLDKQV